LLPLVLVMLAGALLWSLHATAWDLGGRSPILSYDSAQYALAARELMWHGRFATPYVLPLDLAWHSTPPWPLSAVQPGLVLVEALIFKVALAVDGQGSSDSRAWLTLLLPFASYLMLGASAVLGTRHLLARYAPDAPRWIKIGAPATLGLLMVLDAEAQHFAMSGLTELPFTVLYLAAILGLARGAGVEYPLVYGLLLGLAGLFRANMLWLAPPCALACAWCAPPGRRLRVAMLVLVGYALPLTPWWLYKWRAFGSPAWDITRFVVWDQVEGRSWFGLYHAAHVPELPGGLTAMRLLLAKAWHNGPQLVLPLLEGPRGLWLGALVAWLCTRPRRTLAAAAGVLLVGLLLNTAAACVSIPWLRYVFPTRLLLEAAGLLALWNLLRRIPGAGARTRNTLCVLAGIMAIVWGAWRTSLAHEEAIQTARVRGVPSSATLTSLSVALNKGLSPRETLMSNLGPALAWQTSHPVIHLAESPAEVAACRLRHDFRNILLVFRSSEHAWTGWRELVERPGAYATVPELGVTQERRFITSDGFTVVWLVLGPLPTQMAAVGR
jgi:hypothetical protein